LGDGPVVDWVAGVAEAVLVEIELVRVGVGGAVVVDVEDGVVVGVAVAPKRPGRMNRGRAPGPALSS